MVQASFRSAALPLALCAAAGALVLLGQHKRRIVQAAAERELRDAAVSTLSSKQAGTSELHDVTDLLRRYPEYWRDHVLHDTLNYRHGVQCPVVSHDSAGCRLQAVVRFGQQTRGHPDLVHGGITALTFDNLQGWCMFMDGRTNVLTAYLHVDFKAPLPTHTTVLAEVRIDRQEGRKLFASGTIRTLDGSITFATCSSLFIIPRDQTVFHSPSQLQA